MSEPNLHTLVGDAESRPLSVHDILGTIEGLRNYGAALRDAATTTVHDIEGHGTGVLADPVALAEISVWLVEAADELHGLIPDGPVVGVADKRRTRTLIRIIGYDSKTGAVQAILPGWNPEVAVEIEGVDSEMNEMLGRLEHDDNPASEDSPVRVHAWVNLGAPNATALEFSDWEISK